MMTTMNERLAQLFTYLDQLTRLNSQGNIQVYSEINSVMAEINKELQVNVK